MVCAGNMVAANTLQCKRSYPTIASGQMPDGAVPTAFNTLSTVRAETVRIRFHPVLALASMLVGPSLSGDIYPSTDCPALRARTAISIALPVLQRIFWKQ
jgi:hypothetical protein